MRPKLLFQALPLRALDSDGRLTISTVTVDDSGDYTCTAVGVPGNSQATARLTVESTCEFKSQHLL